MLIAPLAGGQISHFLHPTVLRLTGIHILLYTRRTTVLCNVHQMEPSAYNDVHTGGRARSVLLAALVMGANAKGRGTHITVVLDSYYSLFSVTNFSALLLPQRWSDRNKKHIAARRSGMVCYDFSLSLLERNSKCENFQWKYALKRRSRFKNFSDTTSTFRTATVCSRLVLHN